MNISVLLLTVTYQKRYLENRNLKQVQHMWYSAYYLEAGVIMGHAFSARRTEFISFGTEKYMEHACHRLQK